MLGLIWGGALPFFSQSKSVVVGLSGIRIESFDSGNVAETNASMAASACIRFGENTGDHNIRRTKYHGITNRWPKDLWVMSGPLDVSCFLRHAGPIRSEPTLPQPVPW
jgi:hypothetical protein